MFSGMPQKGYVCQCALGIKYVPDDVVKICVVSINFENISNGFDFAYNNYNIPMLEYAFG